MESKLFSTPIILTVITGTLYGEMQELYDILRFLTGEGIFTHQIPRALKECGPALREQIPQLKDLVVPEKDVLLWVAQHIANLGGSMLVHPLPEGTYTAKDPVQELVDIREDPIAVAARLKHS